MPTANRFCYIADFHEELNDLHDFACVAWDASDMAIPECATAFRINNFAITDASRDRDTKRRYPFDLDLGVGIVGTVIFLTPAQADDFDVVTKGFTRNMYKIVGPSIYSKYSYNLCLSTNGPPQWRTRQYNFSYVYADLLQRRGQPTVTNS